MEHSDFRIGETFWCSDRQWRCTDIGVRTVIAIRIDEVQVEGNYPELRRTLSGAEAEAEGWFKGPPYAVAEVVFDEDYLPACSLEPDDDDTDAANEPSLDRPDAPEFKRDAFGFPFRDRHRYIDEHGRLKPEFRKSD